MSRVLLFLAVLTSNTISFAAADPLPTSSLSLAQAWQYGGALMWVLLAMSIFGVALCIYFAIVMRTNRITPYSVHRDLSQSLSNADTREARRICEDTPSPLSSVILATLDAIDTAPKADYTLIRSVAESEGSRQAEQIQGQAQYLFDIAGIAPMVGLLGTVIGLLRAFGAVSANIAAAKPTLLAEGVSQAIITTIFGLLIAIPAMIAYAYFRRRASHLIADLESSCAQMIAIIGGKHTQG